MSLRVKVGDITAIYDVEVIVNAANGKGPMGLGVAGAIGYAGGLELRNAVRRICEGNGGFKEGDCYISPPGDLADKGVKAVYHAVTMEYPGGPTSTHIVGQAMRNTLNAAVANGVKSIAFPGLGTGVGQLNPQQVASIMIGIAEKYADKINITIIDIDKDFIEFAKQARKTEA
jgi:O-acetyl-ADP-ribose deacetylase (regulator of RNase III)